MPTLPPEHLNPDEDQPHRLRRVAESFGADAERYDRARPRYPDAMVARIIAASPGPDLLDVGCGTGIAARQFQAAGCRVLGVDPDPRMADRARRTGVGVEVATFEDWAPAGRSFDAVIAAQSWHWVDPVAGSHRAARVLRPAGRLAVFWNAFTFPSDLDDALTAVYHRVVPEMPVAQRGMPDPTGYVTLIGRVADGLRRMDAFGEPEEWRFTWERVYRREDWLDQLPTFGGHGDLPPATLAELLAGTGAAIDAAGGAFTMRYTTMVLTAARTAAA